MKRISALLLAMGLVVTPPAIAQDWRNQWSPGQARDSVRQGKTVPLSQIFQSLKRQYGDWMTGDGRKMRFTVDARTGAVLDRQGA